MSHRIFISYSKQEPAPTTELAAFLEAQGYAVWWDTNLTSGVDYREVIDRELDLADAVIVVWTTRSITSRWVIAEAEHAERRGKLLPLRTREVDLWKIPKPYSTYHTDLVDDRTAVLAAISRLTGAGTEIRPSPRGKDGSAAGGDDRRFAEAERAGTREAYKLYLSEYADGTHASLARIRVAQMEQTKHKTPVEPSKHQKVDALGSRKRTGKIKWYNATKGYGFLTADDNGKDIFLYYRTLDRSGVASAQEGQKVGFVAEYDSKGRETVAELVVLS